MDKKTQQFPALFHHRWGVPVLAELHRSGGGKFVTLVHRLGVSRDSLRQTLSGLIAAGWVMRNPGYGHPLRPEYVLTRAGRRLGPWSVRLMRLLGSLKVEDAMLRKWSVPVAYALRRGHARFSEVRAVLPALTARGLALTLKQLQAAGLVERVVADHYPPSTFYELTPSGRRIGRLLEGL